MQDSDRDASEALLALRSASTSAAKPNVSDAIEPNLFGAEAPVLSIAPPAANKENLPNLSNAVEWQHVIVLRNEKKDPQVQCKFCVTPSCVTACSRDHCMDYLFIFLAAYSTFPALPCYRRTREGATGIAGCQRTGNRLQPCLAAGCVSYSGNRICYQSRLQSTMRNCTRIGRCSIAYLVFAVATQAKLESHWVLS